MIITEGNILFSSVGLRLENGFCFKKVQAKAERLQTSEEGDD